jgi:2-deoxy-D-gluconate 3-dehydrogenase
MTEPWRASAEREAIILDRVPEGRWGEPAEIAEAVAWLVLPASGYVNGHVLAVDGGYLTR